MSEQYEHIIRSQQVQLINDVIGTSKLTLAQRVEVRVFLGDLCDVAEAGRACVAMLGAQSNPVRDGGSQALVEATYMLGVALRKIPQVPQ